MSVMTPVVPPFTLTVALIRGPSESLTVPFTVTFCAYVHKGNMLNSMSVFGAVSMDTLKETYDKLVFMYRYMLDTPIEEYPTAKLSELINKNNSIVEQVLKL